MIDSVLRRKNLCEHATRLQEPAYCDVGSKSAKSVMKITRRDLLRGGGSLAVILFGDSLMGAATRKHSRRRSGGSKRAGSKHARSKRSSKRTRAVKSAHIEDAGALAGSKLFEDVISYYNLGEHRTASDVDQRTSRWLADQLRLTGLQTTFQTFGLRQFFLHQSRLSIGNKPIRCFPLWFPRAANPAISALPVLHDRRTPRPLKGNIAVVRFPLGNESAMSEGQAAIIQDAVKYGASAVIAITESPTKEIVALNITAGAEPWTVPVVLVGERDAAELTSAAGSHEKTLLLVDGVDDPNATARNVVARLSRGKDLIVVSTPQSGWFRCAAERGPGIALFLGLARWASRRTSGSSFLFVSTSGHELGGLGMRAFQKELAPAPGRVLCWLHLGAGIAAYPWEETATGWKRLLQPDSGRLLMSSADLVPVLTSTFAGQPGLTPTTGRAVGEFEPIVKAGYRTFGIAAAHRFHHTPADSPEMTGPQILEPIGRALITSLEAVEKSSGSEAPR